MLVESVNMADVVRGVGPQVTRLKKGGDPSRKVRQPAPQVEEISGAAQTGCSVQGTSANRAGWSWQKELELQQRLINEALAKRPGGSKRKWEPLGLGGKKTSVAPAQPVVASQPVVATKAVVAATPVVASQAVQEGGNVRAEAVSDIQGSGLRLDRRAELVKLAQPLLDQGLSVPEVHAALERFVQRKQWGYLPPVTRDGIVQSAWNALVDADCEREAAEEAAEKAAQQAGPLVPEADELQEVSLAGIAPEPVRWLWPGKIPLGRVTVIYGEAGLGKTSVGLDLAARVSAGTNWPDGAGAPEAGRVLIVNGEDPLQDTICPRLRSSGAKVENVSVIAGMQTPAKPGSPGVAAGGAAAMRGFDLGRDLPVLRKRVETLGNVRLVIIDPLEAYCGKVGSNRAKLRELVAELTKLAADCGVAVVVISAATRCDLPVKHVWRVDCQVLDATARCWVPVRHNCGALPDGLAFRINGDGVVWQQGGEAPTESRVRGTSARGERRRQLQEQAHWLRDFLKAEPRPAKEVLAAAGAAGWSTGQMKRAKRELGIRCYKESAEKGRWFWDACGN